MQLQKMNHCQRSAARRLVSLLVLLALSLPPAVSGEEPPGSLRETDPAEARERAAAYVAAVRKQYDAVTAMMAMQLGFGGCCGAPVERPAGYRGLLHDLRIVVQGPAPAEPEPPRLGSAEFVRLNAEGFTGHIEGRYNPSRTGQPFFPRRYSLLPADDPTADTLDRPRRLPLGWIIGSTFTVEKGVEECRYDGKVFAHKDRYLSTNQSHGAQLIANDDPARGQLNLTDLLLTGGLSMNRSWSEMGFELKGRDLFPAPAGNELHAGGGELVVTNPRAGGRAHAKNIGGYSVTYRDNPNKGDQYTVTRNVTWDTGTQPDFTPSFPGAADFKGIGGSSCPYYDTAFKQQNLIIDVPAVDLYRLTGLRLMQGYGPGAEEIPTGATIDIFNESWGAGGYNGVRDWWVMAELAGAPPGSLGDRRIGLEKLAVRTTGEIDQGLRPTRGFGPGRATAEVALAVPGVEAILPVKLAFTLNRPEIGLTTRKGGLASGESHAVRLDGIVADMANYQVHWEARAIGKAGNGLLGIRVSSDGGREALITPSLKAADGGPDSQLPALLRDENGPRLQVVAEVRDKTGVSVGAAAFKEVRLRPTVTKIILRAVPGAEKNAAQGDGPHDLFLTGDNQGARLTASLVIDGQTLGPVSLGALAGLIDVQQDSSRKLLKNDQGQVRAAISASPGTARVRAVVADSAALATPGSNPVYSEPLEFTINRAYLVEQAGQGARLFIEGPADMASYNAVWLLSDVGRIPTAFIRQEGVWTSAVDPAPEQRVQKVEIYHQGTEKVVSLDAHNTARIAPAIDLFAPDPFIPGATVAAEAVLTGLDEQLLPKLYCRWSSDSGEVLIAEAALRKGEGGPAYCATAIRLDDPAPAATAAVAVQLWMKGLVFMALEKVGP